jgi:hypothetical protein
MSSTAPREPRVTVEEKDDRIRPPKLGDVIIKFPRIDFPRETHVRYTPWLVVRSANGDQGSRPLPAGSVHWESPDVWVESRLGVNQPIPGEDNQLFARVSNLGLQDATGVIVRFWVAFPSLAIVAPQLIATGYANIQSRDSAVIECPIKWIPDVANGGHQCLIVEAFIPAFDDLTAPLDSFDDRHVGQKNEQLVMLPPGQFFSTRVQAANAMSFPQELTFEVQPLRPAAVPELLRASVTLGRALPNDLVPAASVLPLAFRFSDSPALFTGPSAVFARRLLTQTLQEVGGVAKYCSAPAQITRKAQFEPWEARMIDISGQVPLDARPGQTFSFRIVQRAGRMITGGYTVKVVVTEARDRKQSEVPKEVSR